MTLIKCMYSWVQDCLNFCWHRKDVYLQVIKMGIRNQNWRKRAFSSFHSSFVVAQIHLRELLKKLFSHIICPDPAVGEFSNQLYHAWYSHVLLTNCLFPLVYWLIVHFWESTNIHEISVWYHTLIWLEEQRMWLAWYYK